MNCKGLTSFVILRTAVVVSFVAQSLHSPGDTEEIYKIAVYPVSWQVRDPYEFAAEMVLPTAKWDNLSKLSRLGSQLTKYKRRVPS